MIVFTSSFSLYSSNVSTSLIFNVSKSLTGYLEVNAIPSEFVFIFSKTLSFASSISNVTPSSFISLLSLSTFTIFI